MTQGQSFDVEVGSDNVFADLGFDAEEAMSLKIKADLILNLRDYIQRQGWTRREAADFLGEPLPSVSNLMSGEISRFTIDKLIELLGKSGMEVKIEVVSKAA